MDHSLAGSGIRLTYLQDRREIAKIEWPAVLDDLTDAGAPPNRCQWRDLDGMTHVVLAIDRATERHSGVLGIVERTTAQEPWLQIEAAMVRPGQDGVMLLRAMVAHALARIISLDGKPAAIAAPRADRTMAPVLRDLGMHIRTSGLHPPPDGNVIGFRAASLAGRIGLENLVLDLRPVAEVSLLQDLRDMHRIRADSVKTRLALGTMVKAARSASATRRPRTATHTGRSV